MLLAKTIERNRALVDTAASLHQRGIIEPDSYVLDVDAIIKNASEMVEEARRLGLRLYYMSKQIGRCPTVCRILEDIGFSGAVAVDFREAKVLMSHGLHLCHAGHLVQLPRASLREIIRYGVDYITFYSLEKLEEINEAAGAEGKIQKVTIKVCGSNDFLYDGQRSGFLPEEFAKVALAAKGLGNIRLCGVTSFPCMLYDQQSNSIKPTANLETVLSARDYFAGMGFEITEVNTPSANNKASMELLKSMGSTTLEPGHGLTGSTPYNAANGSGEVPSMVYVTEVSHSFRGKGYCYGGGNYRRSHMENALVFEGETEKIVGIKPPSLESIDYYFELDQECMVSATVVAAFRTQIFTTRSQVVAVEGISVGKPKILSITDSAGRYL